MNIIVIALLGLAIGGTSAWYAIRENQSIGSIRIGSWSAWPFVGGQNVDPYTGARVTVERNIPLGAAEGLAFEAATDNEDKLLSLECSYILEGTVPQAQLWTLVAYAAEGHRLANSRVGTASLVSTDLLRYPDGSFRIVISPDPHPGNWLSVEGKGKFKLTMRLYDTPATSNSGLLDPTMPAIRKTGCQA